MRGLNRAYAIAAIILIAIVALIAVDALQAGQFGPEGGASWEKAPDFTLRDIYGRRFSLSDFRGKVVILDFFTTYCEPCKAEIGELKRLKSRFGAQVVIISISIYSGDTDDVLRDYAEEHGITWRVARDTANLADAYGVSAVPTLVIIDKEGYIRHKHVGFTSYEALENEVMELLEA